MPTEKEALTLDGHEVTISNPSKVFFPGAGVTKLDLVRYYIAVSDGALRGVRDRPMALKRFVNGAGGEFFFQKRAPASVPDYISTVELSFPSGRTADEIIASNTAALAWVVNLGCIDLNPHAVRASDVEHPDELRVDLDPGPGVRWGDVREVAMVVRQVLDDHGCVSWPKTSGSRGIHIYVRLRPEWGFGEVRRAALALAREVERRAPSLATSKWWKEERHGVFIDYNQNAKDRTVASAYSVRPVPDARVSAPLEWSEVPDAELADFTVDSVTTRFTRVGDPWAEMDAVAYSLEPLLELSARQEAEGQGDAPWPPHYAKQAGEPPRVQPSKRRSSPETAASKPRRAPERPTSKPRRAPEGPVPNPSAPRGRAGSVAPALPAAPARRADGTVAPTGRRRSSQPLVVISQAASKEDALAGLEQWRSRHPEAASQLAVDDVLVDAMRGRFTVWWRIRVNLRHVPAEERPEAEPPDPDYDPWQA